jgi:ribosomal protein S18 acetylase RimI-like enzyme
MDKYYCNRHRVASAEAAVTAAAPASKMDETMLRELELEDMDRAAAVCRASFDHALPLLAGLHTPEEDRRFFRERVFTSCRVWGYFDDNELAGVIAFREGWIDQLYVRPSSQRRGIGTALLRLAQNQSASLSLWTFQRNEAARRFYEKHAFMLVEETDGGSNEEKEPDAMYRWPSSR